MRPAANDPPTIPRPEHGLAQGMPGPAAWRWWICVLLFLVTVLSYLDRQAIAICATPICREFGLSNEQFGNLLAAFRWTYAAVQLPAGWLADRAPLRGTYALAVGLWSLAGAAAAWVPGARMFAWARAMLGAGEAFNTPCALRTTADVLPAEDRALGNGLFNSGAATGALVAPFVIAPIATAWGWRSAFLVVGCLGAGWIVLWWTFTRSRLGTPRPATSIAAGATLGKELAAMLSRPAFWLLAAFSATINPGWYFCAEWIPKYMHDQRGFAELSAGLITIPVFLAADAGNLASGAIVKLLARFGWRVPRARAAASLFAAAMVLPASAAGDVASPYLSIAVLALAAFGLMALMNNYLASIQDFSLARVGFVAGILGALGNVAGDFASPLIGRFVDQSSRYQAVFVLLSVVSLTGMVALVAADALVAKTSQAAEAP